MLEQFTQLVSEISCLSVLTVRVLDACYKLDDLSVIKELLLTINVEKIVFSQYFFSTELRNLEKIVISFSSLSFPIKTNDRLFCNAYTYLFTYSDSLLFSFSIYPKYLDTIITIL